MENENKKHASADMTVKELKEHIREKNKEVNAVIADYWKRIRIDGDERDILVDGRIQQLQKLTGTEMREGAKIKLSLSGATKDKLLFQARQLDTFISWTGIMDMGNRDSDGLTEKGRKSYDTFRYKWGLSRKELSPQKWMDLMDVFSSMNDWKDSFGYEDEMQHDTFVDEISKVIMEEQVSSSDLIKIMNKMAKDEKKRKRKLNTTTKIVLKLRREIGNAAKKKNKNK